MNFIDIIILVIVLFGGYLGFRKGLVIELSTLVALAGGTYAGLKFSAIVSNWVMQYSSSEFVPLIAFGCCFLAVVILVFFLGKWLEKFVKITMLKPVDRILGGVFALGKYILLIAVLLIFIEKWNTINPFIDEEMRNNSLLYGPLTDLGNLFQPLLGEELKQVPI